MPCHKLILLTGIGQSYDTSGVIKWKRSKQQRTDSLDAWRCGKMIWKEFQIKLKLTNGKRLRVYYWVIVRTREVATHERSVRVARGDSRVWLLECLAILPSATIRHFYISHNAPYYSFKIFPRFWLAKSTRLIHHNQLLMTKFGRILCLARKWRQKCSVLAG